MTFGMAALMAIAGFLMNASQNAFDVTNTLFGNVVAVTGDAHQSKVAQDIFKQELRYGRSLQMREDVRDVNTMMLESVHAHLFMGSIILGICFSMIIEGYPPFETARMLRGLFAVLSSWAATFVLLSLWLALRFQSKISGIARERLLTRDRFAMPNDRMVGRMGGGNLINQMANLHGSVLRWLSDFGLSTSDKHDSEGPVRRQAREKVTRSRVVGQDDSPMDIEPLRLGLFAWTHDSGVGSDKHRLIDVPPFLIGETVIRQRWSYLKNSDLVTTFAVHGQATLYVSACSADFGAGFETSEKENAGMKMSKTETKGALLSTEAFSHALHITTQRPILEQEELPQILLGAHDQWLGEGGFGQLRPVEGFSIHVDNEGGILRELPLYKIVLRDADPNDGLVKVVLKWRFRGGCTAPLIIVRKGQVHCKEEDWPIAEFNQEILALMPLRDFSGVYLRFSVVNLLLAALMCFTSRQWLLRDLPAPFFEQSLMFIAILPALLVIWAVPVQVKELINLNMPPRSFDFNFADRQSKADADRRGIKRTFVKQFDADPHVLTPQARAAAAARGSASGDFCEAGHRVSIHSDDCLADASVSCHDLAPCVGDGSNFEASSDQLDLEAGKVETAWRSRPIFGFDGDLSPAPARRHKASPPPPLGCDGDSARRAASEMANAAAVVAAAAADAAVAAAPLAAAPLALCSLVPASRCERSRIDASSGNRRPIIADARPVRAMPPLRSDQFAGDEAAFAGFYEERRFAQGAAATACAADADGRAAPVSPASSAAAAVFSAASAEDNLTVTFTEEPSLALHLSDENVTSEDVSRTAKSGWRCRTALNHLRAGFRWLGQRFVEESIFESKRSPPSTSDSTTSTLMFWTVVWKSLYCASVLSVVFAPINRGWDGPQTSDSSGRRLKTDAEVSRAVQDRPSFSGGAPSQPRAAAVLPWVAVDVLWPPFFYPVAAALEGARLHVTDGFTLRTFGRQGAPNASRAGVGHFAPGPPWSLPFDGVRALAVLRSGSRGQSSAARLGAVSEAGVYEIVVPKDRESAHASAAVVRGQRALPFAAAGVQPALVPSGASRLPRSLPPNALAALRGTPGVGADVGNGAVVPGDFAASAAGGKAALVQAAADGEGSGDFGAGAEGEEAEEVAVAVVGADGELLLCAALPASPAQAAAADADAEAVAPSPAAAAEDPGRPRPPLRVLARSWPFPAGSRVSALYACPAGQCADEPVLWVALAEARGSRRGSGRASGLLALGLSSGLELGNFAVSSGDDADAAVVAAIAGNATHLAVVLAAETRAADGSLHRQLLPSLFVTQRPTLRSAGVGDLEL
eukprot:TRINITY_DN19368_c0_g3_i1.p1 TRINITY_DN19368_c0_g3~~TRINITY_DN19368_c0_g3_i1.p1  ORF type:complete len:1321 (+),score=265.64 TRINITY_DN19368_c0_g3_i1:216-4178(+)